MVCSLNLSSQATGSCGYRDFFFLPATHDQKSCVCYDPLSHHMHKFNQDHSLTHCNCQNEQIRFKNAAGCTKTSIVINLSSNHMIESIVFLFGAVEYDHKLILSVTLLRLRTETGMPRHKLNKLNTIFNNVR